MKFLEKIEDAINKLLLMAGSLMMGLMNRLMPSKIKILWQKIKVFLKQKSDLIRSLPGKAKFQFTKNLSKLRASVSSINVRNKVTTIYRENLQKYFPPSSEKKKISRILSPLLLPLVAISKWFNALSATQTLGVLFFSGVSILSGISILSSGQRLMSQNGSSRTPASIQEDISYQRPAYYKKQDRHLELSNLKLPVFFADINEVKSISIDFMATLTNRMSKMQLQKLEVQLRDHFVLNIEPIVPSFPLEEEGKIIIREKLISEINIFMREWEIEGEVSDLKFTYVLAN
jgi:hypothetical protein